MVQECKLGTVVGGLAALSPIILKIFSVTWAYLPLDLEITQDAEDVVNVDRFVPRSIDIVDS
jgi:hypothetical protein